MTRCRILGEIIIFTDELVSGEKRMKNTVLLTGAAGFLGRHLNKKLTDKGFCVKACSHSDLDITDSDSVRSVVTTIKPDYIVHCAAISSTSYAKEHPDESYAVNVRGSVNLSQVCHSNGIPLFLMSSDQVYGGCELQGPLAEIPDPEQPLRPNNAYGEHKLLMESKVLETMPDAVLLRLSWMYESYNPEQPHTDIVSNILRAIKESRTIKCSTREYRAMIFIPDTETGLVKVLEQNFRPIPE